MIYAIAATRNLVVTGWDLGAIGQIALAILIFDAVGLKIAAWALRRRLE